jgi:N-methylhydantoinase B/oxoprolinase/acetone carboxylase alpha subunit
MKDASHASLASASLSNNPAQLEIYKHLFAAVAEELGARPTADGPSALHSHMTNTLNTPVEALEYAYPLRVERYEVWRGSGGRGYGAPTRASKRSCAASLLLPRSTCLRNCAIHQVAA